ncbi:MAG: FHA domain-containing protein [Phycisphaeraceae bacterium]
MATILVLCGQNEGEWYGVPDHRPLVLGRDETLLAAIQDPCASRRHCEIHFDQRDERYYAVDLHSRNGVKVNGERIDHYTELWEDDTVQIGHTLFCFTLEQVPDDRRAQQLIEASKTRHRELVEKVNRRKSRKEKKAVGAGAEGEHRGLGSLVASLFHRSH